MKIAASVNIWQSYGQEYIGCPVFFRLTGYIRVIYNLFPQFLLTEDNAEKSNQRLFDCKDER